jgi:D-galacturonate reductase
MGNKEVTNVDSKIDVLIIGTGMYVSGNGTDGYGTVFPAIIQAKMKGQIDDVHIAGRSKSSLKAFDLKARAIFNQLAGEIMYFKYPHKVEIDNFAYREALSKLKKNSAVIVVTPDHLHEEMALDIINSGHHLLVVKPLTPTVEGTRNLIHRAKECNVYGAVEFHKRWDWANLKMREVITNGSIGELQYFHVEYSQRKSIPAEIFRSWVETTNIFQYLGVHYVDIIYFITRKSPVRLVAIGQKSWLAERGIDTYDSIQVLIEWDSGFTSSFLTNWIDPEKNDAMSHQKIKVIGTKGRLESDQTERGARLVSDENGTEEINPYFCQPYHDLDIGKIRYRGYGIDSITQFISDVNDISSGIKTSSSFDHCRPTFKESLISSAVVSAVNMSLSSENCWVCFDSEMNLSI